MLKKLIPKQALIEAGCILIIAVILSFVINLLHPKRVKITSIRPSIEYSADSILTQTLPPANIHVERTDELTAEQIPAEHPVIDTKQLIKLIAENQVVLLDARSEDEFLKFHIPNSQNLPFEELMEYEEMFNSLPRDKWLICYCDGPPCDLGKLLADELIIAGYQKVFIYHKGIRGWIKANHAIQ